MKKLSKICILLLLSINLFPCKTKSVYAEENNRLLLISDRTETIVGELPNANITLYATREDWVFKEFRLQAYGKEKLFPSWVNVTNKTYRPQLLYKDINNDSKKELIIVLTTGYGTGILEQKVHVFHRIKTNKGIIFKEVPVNNPVVILNRTAKLKLTKSKAIITLKNKKTIIDINKLGINPEHLFTNIIVGNIIRFDVINGVLTVNIGAQVSPVGGYIGYFQIKYTYKGNMYQVKEISFYEK